MILLPPENRCLYEVVLNTLGQAKMDGLDLTVADFDGFIAHVGPGSTPTAFLVSVQWRCLQQILKFSQDLVKQVYGAMLQANPEPGYQVSLEIDAAKVPEDKREAIAKKVSFLKRHLFAGPFLRVFADVEKGSAKGILQVAYRDEETLFIKPEQGQVSVIFTVYFRDADDAVIAKVFLNEFADARKTISNAPTVQYRIKEAPLELKGVRNLRVDEHTGYVTFVLFKNHISEKNRDRTIDSIQLFRNYLHYHIKCSKAYLHKRMRTRVTSWLQVLNRAKMEGEKKDKKTISGRTFVRK